MVIGVDEVGRGCLAGPVCVAAVALDIDLPGLNDSKKLSSKQRNTLALAVKQRAQYIGIGWASHRLIDELGIVRALRVAGKAATAACLSAELILLDGNHNYLDDERVVTYVRGDAEVPAIAAASIIAKVARDAFMAAAGKRYPQYGFEQHVGYATAAHVRQLALLGPTPIHRLSFAPLKRR